MSSRLDKCSQIAAMVARDNLEKVNRNTKKICPRKSLYERYFKRLLDLLISIPIFIVTFPINIVIGIVTYFDVGNPIFFKQKRIGKNGKPFELVKFRNMTNDVDVFGNLLPASERITKFGRFMRKYSLDELLNFWSIIKGDMSIIGPRPLPIEFEPRYSERHKMRAAVRPGLECPTLNRESKIRFYQEQFENDIWYVENVSFLVDCKMVISLFRMVFNSKERGDHATVGGGYFVGYDENMVAFSMRRIPEKYEMEYRKIHSSNIHSINERKIV